ncbi:MAG: STAS domain-containing protein [Treponema sp.]|jgi:anti-sigma B factor antagonist|nr:STAS domain-containing protein [Treponema sp.]
MEIVKTQTDDTVTLAVSGKLSAATAGELDAAVAASIAASNKLVIDFKEVSYLASAGLRILISTHKKLTAKHGSFTLRNVCESVREVFEITGLDDVFDIQ